MSISIIFISLVTLLVWLIIVCRKEAKILKEKIVRNSYISGQRIWC